MDAQRLGFADEFDAIFSNAALHWMLDADGVVSGVARALKKGGRFVGEFGGHGNVAAIVTAIYAALKLNGCKNAIERPLVLPDSQRVYGETGKQWLTRKRNRSTSEADAASYGHRGMARNLRRADAEFCGARKTASCIGYRRYIACPGSNG